VNNYRGYFLDASIALPDNDHIDLKNKYHLP